MREILSVHRIGYRLLGMIHGVDSTIMPLHLLEVCLSVVQVYAGLYLTAGLIDLLLAGAYGQAAEWALYLLLVNLLLGTVTVLLKRKFRGMETRIWQLFYVWMREKAFSLDYETHLAVGGHGALCVYGPAVTGSGFLGNAGKASAFDDIVWRGACGDGRRLVEGVQPVRSQDSGDI